MKNEKYIMIDPAQLKKLARREHEVRLAEERNEELSKLNNGYHEYLLEVSEELEELEDRNDRHFCFNVLITVANVAVAVLNAVLLWGFLA